MKLPSATYPVISNLKQVRAPPAAPTAAAQLSRRSHASSAIPSSVLAQGQPVPHKHLAVPCETPTAYHDLQTTCLQEPHRSSFVLVTGSIPHGSKTEQRHHSMSTRPMFPSGTTASPGISTFPHSPPQEEVIWEEQRLADLRREDPFPWLFPSPTSPPAKDSWAASLPGLLYMALATVT